ncbi:hypothetical protein L1887_52858 [Cichorium endivia]|nr:hypothetical protein L1887_52858 [Cichorium endivia]
MNKRQWIVLVDVGLMQRRCCQDFIIVGGPPTPKPLATSYEAPVAYARLCAPAASMRPTLASRRGRPGHQAEEAVERHEQERKFEPTYPVRGLLDRIRSSLGSEANPVARSRGRDGGKGGRTAFRLARRRKANEPGRSEEDASTIYSLRALALRGAAEEEGPHRHGHGRRPTSHHGHNTLVQRKGLSSGASSCRSSRVCMATARQPERAGEGTGEKSDGGGGAGRTVKPADRPGSYLPESWPIGRHLSCFPLQINGKRPGRRQQRARRPSSDRAKAGVGRPTGVKLASGEQQQPMHSCRVSQARLLGRKEGNRIQRAVFLPLPGPAASGSSNARLQPAPNTQTTREAGKKIKIKKGPNPRKPKFKARGSLRLDSSSACRAVAGSIDTDLSSNERVLKSFALLTAWQPTRPGTLMFACLEPTQRKSFRPRPATWSYSALAALRPVDRAALEPPCQLVHSALVALRWPSVDHGANSSTLTPLVQKEVYCSYLSQATGSQGLRMEWLGLAPGSDAQKGARNPVKSTASGTSRRNGETVYCISFSDCPPQMGDLPRSANQAAWLRLAHAARCSDRPRCCGISAMADRSVQRPSSSAVHAASCGSCLRLVHGRRCVELMPRRWPGVQPSKDAAQSFSGSCCRCIFGRKCFGSGFGFAVLWIWLWIRRASIKANSGHATSAFRPLAGARLQLLLLTALSIVRRRRQQLSLTQLASIFSSGAASKKNWLAWRATCRRSATSSFESCEPCQEHARNAWPPAQDLFFLPGRVPHANRAPWHPHLDFAKHTCRMFPSQKHRRMKLTYVMLTALRCSSSHLECGVSI